MTRRPLLVTTAAAAALALCAASGTASATTTSSKAVGRGSSSLSLLSLAVGGHQLSLADLVLVSDTVASPRISSVSVTPVTVDGAPYGRQTVDQSSSPQTIGAVSAPSALAPFANLTSPAIDVSATSAPSNHVGATSLGAVKVLGLPIKLSGALQAASAVSTTNGATGLKTVTVDNLALPSIGDVLGALGLKLSALPVGSLDDLLGALDLVNGAVATAEGAVDTAQAAVTSATADLATKTSALGSAQTALTTAQTTLTSATSALSSLISANSALLGPLGITDIASLLAVSPAVLATAEGLVATLASTLSAYTSAQAAVTAAQAAVATAQAAVDTAQALLTTLTNTLTAARTTLLTAVLGVLDSTPLVSLDSLEVTTRAVATSASTGGQQAQVVGGVVKGLKVLGVDVLNRALGSSTLDLAGVATSVLSKVNSVTSQVTGTLSSVLSSIPSLPVLDVPAPKVSLLTKSTTTSISGGFGRASTVVQGLSISLPAITLPTSVAVPGAASLPGLNGVAQVAGKLTSAPLSLSLLTLRDQAAFRPSLVGGTPGTSGTPGTGGHLANTGLPVGVAVLAILCVSGALVVRRRLVVAG